MTVELFFAVCLSANFFFFFWSEKFAAILKQFYLSSYVSESSFAYSNQKAVEADLYRQVNFNFKKDIF